MTLSDLYDSIELTAFESTYNRFLPLLKDGAALCVTAQVKKRNETVSLSLLSAYSARERSNSVSGSLYVRLSDKGELGGVQKVFSHYRGQTPVCVYFEDSGTAVRSDASHGVRLCNELALELCGIVGLENVKIK